MPLESLGISLNNLILARDVIQNVQGILQKFRGILIVKLSNEWKQMRFLGENMLPIVNEIFAFQILNNHICDYIYDNLLIAVNAHSHAL